jgi:hypothetical protein
MAGKPSKSGRNKSVGQVYEFHFYYHTSPGEDPPELEALLEDIVKARGRKRRDIVRSALLGGAKQGRDIAAKTEDSESASLVDELLNSFL